ncbi:hypothetical protein CWRG_01075 [Chthonomonas calidirosea]|uniref:hypothetical protein n=1 Tax=Chthonomonas calidirosea TaxID=454171 RepID=UPI0006DD460E|nr:hypothetical protein [Chthonomonas calidirosea]CEK15189.1 hypothetical protein CWRG_01075 [Chthonomonas calidirosea]
MPGTALSAGYFRAKTSAAPFAILCFALGLDVLLIVLIGVYNYEHLHAAFAPWLATLTLWTLGLLLYLFGIGVVKAPAWRPRTFIVTNESISVRQGRSLQRIPFNKIRLYALDERLADPDTPHQMALWGNGVFLLVPANIAQLMESQSQNLTQIALQTTPQIREGRIVLRAQRLLRALERRQSRLTMFLILAGLLGTPLLLLSSISMQHTLGTGSPFIVAIGSSMVCLLLWERTYRIQIRKLRVENEILASLTKHSIPFLIEKLHLFCDLQRFDIWQHYGARQALAKIIPTLSETERLVLPARSYLRIYTLLCPQRADEWRQALKSCLDPENLLDAACMTGRFAGIIGLVYVLSVLSDNSPYYYLHLRGDWMENSPSDARPATRTEMENLFQDHQTCCVLLQLLAKTGQHHTLPVLRSFLSDSRYDRIDSVLSQEAENCIEVLTRSLQQSSSVEKSLGQHA